MAMREYGLGCDQVERVELVLADGSPRTVTAASDPEGLFWAVCGGGGNLSFATKWWLRTVPAADVIAFSASWSSPGKEQEIFTTLVRALENEKNAPDTIGAQVSIFATAPNSPRPNKISITGQLRGTMQNFQEILGSAFTDPEPEPQAILPLPYWQAQDFLDIVAVPNRYQETSLFAGKLTDKFIQTAFGLVRTWPGTVKGARVTFSLMGGRVNKFKSDATAFVHRSSQWLVNPALDWTDCNNHGDILDNLKWQRDMQTALSGCMRGSGSYQNFPDPELDNRAEAYWGANYWRLSDVKRRIDPDLVFTPAAKAGNNPLESPCCMDRQPGEISRPHPLSCEANVLRAPKLQHAVQRRDGKWLPRSSAARRSASAARHRSLACSGRYPPPKRHANCNHTPAASLCGRG